jgi:hypothetical protein
MAERWRKLAPLPAGRAGMAAAAYDGQIFAIAGEGPEGVSGSVFRYSPESDSWTQLSDKPTPVADVHAVLIGEKIYVPGGRGVDGRPTNILEIYDPRRDAWLAGASLPEAISAYGLADFEGQMYLFGGWDGERTLDAVYVYDPTADTWRAGTPMALTRRDHAAVALVDKIIVLGGRNADGALKDAASYFPSRDAGGEDPWADFLDLPEERYGFGAVGVSDTIYVMGGMSENRVSDEVLFQYLYSGNVWDLFSQEEFNDVDKINLLSMGQYFYALMYDEEFLKTNFWAYKALFYEIFIPVVN